MHLVAASSTSTAHQKTNAVARWPAIALDRVEEEVRGKVACSAPKKATSVIPSLFYLASTLDAATNTLSTRQLIDVEDSVGDALVRSGSSSTASSPSPSSGSSCSASTSVEGRAVSTPAWSVERRSTAPTRSSACLYASASTT
ncbi:hypothetical protein NBRC10513_001901 [Rhodotorula toruloides]